MQDDYCGDLDWTIKRYGFIVHKENCPYRKERSYHQGDPP